MANEISTWLDETATQFTDRLAAARAHQLHGWLEGNPRPAEDYIRELPTLTDEDKLVLVVGEITARIDRGEVPTIAEYQARFPAFAADLAIQFELLTTFHAGSANRAAPPPAVPGYTITGEIGRGASAAVYRATHNPTKREVALKILVANFDNEAVPRIRFLREGEILAGFDHPNVVRLYEAGVAADRLFLALEFVPGGSLAGRLAKGPFAPEVAAGFIAAVARGLDHAHGHGIVHRDLKPANILVTQSGVPKLTDFGLSRAFRFDIDLTSTGRFVGTPAYAAPEQVAKSSFTPINLAYLAPEQAASASEVGPSADIYALGVVLFECLTGQRPLVADKMQELLRLKLVGTVPDPTTIVPTIPAELAAVCLKCMALRPADRFPTARAVADVLDQWSRPAKSARSASGLSRWWNKGRNPPSGE